jgi:hypothetical protein
MRETIDIIRLTAVVCCLTMAVPAVAQTPAFVPDLSKVTDNKEWGIHNREARVFEDQDMKGVELNANPREGFVWLKNYSFSDGVIECDIRGKDVVGQSFVGVAFHGVDKENFDAIYFRPFNFHQEQVARRSHSVQYISHPTYTWSKLRTDHPGKYENALKNPPDSNAWFHARIVVEGMNVRVFVNDDKEPSLVVEKISNQQNGWIGFWVGNGSDGKFANLKITPKNK